MTSAGLVEGGRVGKVGCPGLLASSTGEHPCFEQGRSGKRGRGGEGWQQNKRASMPPPAGTS